MEGHKPFGFLAACLTFVVGISCELYEPYVVIVPKVIRPGQLTEVFVNIFPETTGPGRVKVELMDESGGRPLISKTVAINPATGATVKFWAPRELPGVSHKLVVTGLRKVIFSASALLRVDRDFEQILLQTDRGVYKPGSKVRYRVMTLGQNLKVPKKTYKVTIKDSERNIIKQDEHLYDITGLVEGELLLADEPVLGDWSIIVETEGDKIQKFFEVKKYVLPRFKVTILPLKSYSLLTDRSIQGTITATYQSGKPLKGRVEVTVKLENWYSWYYRFVDGVRSNVQPVLKQTLDIDGSTKYNFSMAEHLKINSRFANNPFLVEARVIESLTGEAINKSVKISIFNSPFKIEFLGSNPNRFKPGMEYIGQLKLVQPNGLPLEETAENATVSLSYWYLIRQTYPTEGYQKTEWRSLPTLSLSVPKDGIIPFRQSIPKDAISIRMRASYSNVNVVRSYQKSFSNTNTYLQVTLSTLLPQAGEKISITLNSNVAFQKYTVMVLSRGRIIIARQLRKTLPVNTTVVNMKATADMGPTARVIVFFIHGEVVSDAVTFNVLGAVKNKVSMEFDSAEAKPGSDVKLKLRARPQSLVASLVLDQSVIQLRSGFDVTIEEVWGFLGSLDPARNPFSVNSNNGDKAFWTWRYPAYSSAYSYQSVFRDAGTLLITDVRPPTTTTTTPRFTTTTPRLTFPGLTLTPLRSRRPGTTTPIPTTATHPRTTATHPRPTTIHPRPPGRFTTAQGLLPEPTFVPPEALAEVERVRTRFLETWLWDLVKIGRSGEADVSLVAPDSFTTWVGTAFALNNVYGFGITEVPTQLRVISRFYVNVVLPYAVTRGEHVVIQANVFNYLTTDQQVVVELAPSGGFDCLDVDITGEVIPVPACETHTIQVPANSVKSVFFPIVANLLGEMNVTVSARSVTSADALTKQLLVKPEGIPQEYQQTVMLDLSNTTLSSLEKTFTVSFPPNVVQDSERIIVSVRGDVLANTVDGLSDLVQLPTGCGEQNMVKFAPTVFVTNYLESVGQLTPELRRRAVSFTERGYQNQMRFRRHDGSFSVWGNRDKFGSTWLSLFVAKSFQQAQKYIQIDEAQLDETLQFIRTKQLPDGSFRELHEVHNTFLKGSSSKGIALTAYAVIALLDFPHLPELKETAEKATRYIEQRILTLTDPYLIAICAYSLEKAKSAIISQVRQHLARASSNEGDSVFWKAAVPELNDNRPWRRRNSQAPTVEATGYGLKACVEAGEMAKCLPILRWLIDRQNSQGGFISTQDTVVTIDALSMLASNLYSNDFYMDISIQTDSSQNSFSVDNTNRLVLQKTKVDAGPGDIRITGNGRGVAYVQLSVRFNVMADILMPTFDGSVLVVDESYSSFTIEVCTRYLRNESSGMTNIEILTPTGFSPHENTERDLQATARSVEVSDNKVVLYFDKIDENELCFPLTAIRTGLVAKAKPVTVTVFKYYEPEQRLVMSYLPAGLLESDFCDVCDSAFCDSCLLRRKK